MRYFIQNGFAALIRQLGVLLSHSGVRRYGANTLWLMVEKFVRLVVGFSVGIYVARSLGPAQYGLLNYAISFVALFSILVSLGLDSILVRELVKTPARRDELLGSAFGLKGIGFILMAVSIGIVVWLMPVAFSEKILFLIICSGYAFQAFQVLDLYFMSRVQSKYVAISQIIVLLLASVFRLLFSYQAAPLWCFAMVEAGYMAGVVIAYAFFYLRSGLKITDWHFDKSTVLFLLQESWPLLLASAASLIYTRLDQVMITTMVDEGANGQYAVALRLVELLFFVPIVVSDSFLPSLVGTRGISEARYLQRSAWLLKGMFYLALAGFIPIAWSGSRLIEVLYGQAYHEAAQLFLIFCLKMILVYPGMIYSKWMIVENMQRIMLFSTIGGAIVNIILNIFWIRTWGAIGAVWATLASTLSIYLFFPLVFRRGRRAVTFLLQSLLLWK